MLVALVLLFGLLKRLLSISTFTVFSGSTPASVTYLSGRGWTNFRFRLSLLSFLILYRVFSTGRSAFDSLNLCHPTHTIQIICRYSHTLIFGLELDFRLILSSHLNLFFMLPSLNLSSTCFSPIICTTWPFSFLICLFGDLPFLIFGCLMWNSVGYFWLIRFERMILSNHTSCAITPWAEDISIWTNLLALLFTRSISFIKNPSMHGWCLCWSSLHIKSILLRLLTFLLLFIFIGILVLPYRLLLLDLLLMILIHQWFTPTICNMRWLSPLSISLWLFLWDGPCRVWTSMGDIPGVISDLDLLL